MKNKLPIADGRLPVAKPSGGTVCPRTFSLQPSAFSLRSGFTLVELLVVISVIAVLAGLIFSTMSSVKRRQYISHTQAELGQLQAAIENYKAAYGFYPPDNPGNPLTNQLYYELVGTTNCDNAGDFRVLDNPNDQVNPQAAFGVAGFVNSSKFNANEEARPAQNFLHELRPNQTMTFNGVTLLAASVGVVTATYQPLPGAPGVNPWRYNSSNPTNNPGGYELYVQIVIGVKTNLICNWSKQVQINSPLP